MHTRLLVANFFPAFHPSTSGGEQRYFCLYRYLSRWFDVTLLSPTYTHGADEIVTHSDTFREHRVPKDPIFDRLHWKLDEQGIGPECSGYVVALAGAFDTAFGRRFAALAKETDVIIHEFPFTLPYDRGLGSDRKARIYNAHNVEHRLAAQMLRGEAGRKAVEFIRFLENSLVHASNLVLVTSGDERQQMAADFGVDSRRIVLAPNGFEAADQAPALDACGDRPLHETRPTAVFMGSAHPPNVEAAHYIVQKLAPALPDVEFRLIGAVCRHLPAGLPENVTSLGFVSEADKARELRQCGVALNPLFSGAGTNLKMLDYMAAGAPIATTPVGARGLDLEDGLDARIVSPVGFARAVQAIVADYGAGRALGIKAQEKALKNFTWSRIAEDIRGAIEAAGFRRREHVPRGSVDRARLLVVNDFPVAEGMGGGHVRIRELLVEFGRSFDVVLLCFGPEPGRRSRLIAPGVRQIEIPKSDEHRDAEQIVGAEAAISVNDILASDYVLANAAFVAEFRDHVSGASAVVFEHPYLAPLTELLPADARVVYSSLNVESDLKAQMLQPRRNGERYAARAAALERRLLLRADLIVCVSEEDRARFMAEFPGKNFAVVENGARFSARDESPFANDRTADASPEGRLAVFIGSAHIPNVHAATFLLASVAPAVPNVTFVIIGGVCDAIGRLPRPANAVLVGALSENEKDALLRRATIALNPLVEGGGSSLKVPDFFSAGLPLVSTAVGVRGYDLQPGVHYLAAEPESFADAVHMLAHDAELRRRLARCAYDYGCTRLDWRALAACYRRRLRELIEPEARPRVLVTTYRFADPPPGGAESFLVNMLRELHRRGNLDLDVATCDVGLISNKWHFSAEYGAADANAAAPAYIDALHRFGLDRADDRRFQKCARLFRVWMEEMRRQSATLPRVYDGPTLLGGWNFAELAEGSPIRWTSAESLVDVGDGARGLAITGYAPRRTTLEVRRGEATATRTVEGRFEWTVELAGTSSVTAIRTEPTFAAEDDPRELGVLVRELAVCEAGAWRSVDLGRDFETVWRSSFAREWVSSLCATTEARERSDDDLFVAVRGPHSTDLRRWLEDNLATYDVVLAQGVPFATPVHVAEIASRRRVPIVLLPHFHMEDRYYHWRRYYDAFRAADCVIAAPSQSKPMFFDPLAANSVALPGGGVDVHEFEPDRLAAGRMGFRALHGSETPFVLVLGRKAGAKNYRIAIEAAARVNAREHRVDVILIGPDEDGIPVDTERVYCYGARSREVVIGALGEALCLVNMSESESFGIVLLESWLAGRPVIAQRRCLAFADLVRDGENGMLAESAEDVSRAIAAYLGDEALARRHAEKGRAVAERCSWDTIAAEIEAVLMAAQYNQKRFLQQLPQNEAPRDSREDGLLVSCK